MRRRLAALAATSAARNVRSLAGAELFGLLLGTVVGLLVARRLGPSSYGAYALVLAAPAALASILDLRGVDTVTRFVRPLLSESEYPSPKAGGVISVCVAFDLVVIAVTSAMVITLAFLGSAIVPVSTLAAAAASVVAASALPIATLRSALIAMDLFGRQARAQMFFASLRAGILLPGLVWKPDVLVLLLLAALGAVMEVVLTGVWVNRALLARTGSGLVVPPLRRLLTPPAELRRFAGWNGASTMASGFVKYGDTLVVGALVGQTSAGYYRLARSLTNPVGVVTGPLQAVLYNKLASAGSGSPRQVVRRLREAALLGLALSAAVLLLLPAAPLLVPLLAGQAYEPAVGLVQIMVLAAAVGCAGYWLRPLMLVTDRMRPLFWASLGIGTLAAGAFVFAASIHGATGLAWSRLLVVSVGGHLVLLLMVRRSLGVLAQREGSSIPPAAAT